MTIPVLDYDPAEDARRQMTGIWSSLTDEQRNLALAYRGDETLGAPHRVPVTASPSPWLFRITIACAVFWAAVVGAFWWWV